MKRNVAGFSCALTWAAVEKNTTLVSFLGVVLCQEITLISLDSFQLLITQHCDVTDLQTQSVVIVRQAGRCEQERIPSAHSASKAGMISADNTEDSGVSVACHRSCQMCEVLLLRPSCRECCLASKNTDSLALWLWQKADWETLQHQ